MRTKSFLGLGAAALAGLLIGILNLNFPLFYSLGLLLMLIVAYIFFSHLGVFMMGLLLLRPVLDQFFVSIRFTILGSSLGLGGALSLFLVVGMLSYLLMGKAGSANIRITIVKQYFWFCIVCAVALIYSPDKGLSIIQVLNYFAVLSILILTLIYIKDEKKASVLVKSILWSWVIPLAYGFVVFLREGGRLQATFSHPNILAFFLLILIGAVFFLRGQESRNVKAAFWMGASLLILITALVLTETRSGWAAFVLMGAVYSLLFNRKFVLPGMLILAVLSATPLVQKKIANIFSSYGNQITINEDGSFGWRLTAWKDLVAAGLKQPLIGHGLNASYGIVKEKLGAHNDYVRFFAETGIIGLIAYFLPYCYLFFHAYKNIKKLKPGSMAQRLAGFFLCFVPAFLLMSVSENLASYVVIHWYIWCLVGIYFALFPSSLIPQAPKLRGS